jgi:hypothetical protein
MGTPEPLCHYIHLATISKAFPTALSRLSFLRGTMSNVEQSRRAANSGQTGDKAAHPKPAETPPGADVKAGTRETKQRTDRNSADERGARADAPVYSAQDVRQGEIILKRPWQRAVFIFGLAGAVLLALFFRFAVPG